MRRAERQAPIAAPVRRRARWVLALLLCLNVGFFVWSQGVLGRLGMASGSEIGRPAGDVATGGMHLLSAQEGAQVQARIALESRQAQALAQAQETEMVLEFETPSQAPAALASPAKTHHAPSAAHSRHKLKNPRHQSAR